MKIISFSLSIWTKENAWGQTLTFCFPKERVFLYTLIYACICIISMGYRLIFLYNWLCTSEKQNDSAIGKKIIRSLQNLVKIFWFDRTRRIDCLWYFLGKVTPFIHFSLSLSSSPNWTSARWFYIIMRICLSSYIVIIMRVFFY